jgi:hypothetical protein
VIDRQRDRASDQIDRNRPPPDVAPPQKGAPAVRGYLGNRVQHHRGRKRQQGQQHPDQDQPAGHAEQAGQKRCRDHQQAECCNQKRRHSNLPASGVDLTFAAALAAGSNANVKSKTPLEIHICWWSFDSSIRKDASRNGMRMLESDHWYFCLACIACANRVILAWHQFS